MSTFILLSLQLQTLESDKAITRVSQLANKRTYAPTGRGRPRAREVVARNNHSMYEFVQRTTIDI